MTLSIYKKKRNFKETPEPTGGQPDVDQLRFVIQKHHASRLHYDLRLEIEGVLKSWAVPKGPSTDPDIKRLAIMVEDHPYDYRNFEGIIPSGYGAGTMIVWDEGFYELADADGKDKKTQDKALQKAIPAGKLHIVLHGKKLKGEYGLIKTKGMSDSAWLLFKVKDAYGSKDDITLKDLSVRSKKTLEQVKKSKSKPLETEQVKGTSAKSKFPTKLSPMLASKVDAPFDREGWQYEIKWDGYRAIAFCNKENVALKSRNDNPFNDKFYTVHKALQEWDIHAVIDGEVVVLEEDGTPNFSALQNWSSEADGALYFYVFDLLWMDGMDLMQLPLVERRTMLKEIIPDNEIIRFSENFEVNGLEFFQTAKKMGLEGIMAKKSDSIYSAGSRSNDWIKIKAHKTEDMVIGGYTINEGTSKSFSSLLLGVFDGGKLLYTGKAGTGFTDQQQKVMLKQFKPYIIKKPSFADQPNINKSSRFQRNPPNATAVWMKPELVCEVRFTEMTDDGVMRHPSFIAMRDDKKATDIIKATTIAAPEVISEKAKQATSGFLSPTEKNQVRNIKGNDLTFTNLDKLYWTKEKITKRDLLNYYDQVAPYILPYLKDRPQSMNRHPDGIDGQSFYFKDVTDTAPDWIETFDYTSDSDDRLKKYLVAKDKASLLYMANLGCIEMNPWHSKVQTEDYPDWCVIDLDPGKNTFDQVVEAANVTKDILENMGVSCYPKTSGSSGIHIYIPFGALYTYEQSKEFARVIATLVQAEIPKYTSIERIVKARKGKMYIDFLQNRSQATIAAPYCLRPKPGATVSMPLHWDEVKKGLKISDFNINNALERIKSEGDLFKPVLGKGIDLEQVIKTYNKEND